MSDFDDFDDDSFELNFDAGLREEGEYEAKIESAEWRVNSEKQNSTGINFTIEYYEDGQKDFKYLWLKNDEKVSRQGLQEMKQIIAAVTGEAPPAQFSMSQLNPVRSNNKIFLSALEGAVVKVIVKHRKNKDQELEQTLRIVAAD